jgi:hypothetical protein
MTSIFNQCNALDEITDISNSHPSLQQGVNFNKYQQKKYNVLEKKKTLPEGFQNQENTRNKIKQIINSDDARYLDNSEEHPLTTESNEVIENNYAISEETKHLKMLQDEYQLELTKYQDKMNNLSLSAENYAKRINPNNPYLGKNIKFTNNVVCYVTNQGVAKPIHPFVWNSIQEKNGCPDKTTTNVDIPWEPKYRIPGTQIGDLNLISGTRMRFRESCGNEGKNIYVDSMMDNPTDEYLGCFNDAPPATEVMLVPVMNSSNNVSGFQSSASSIFQNNNSSFGPWAAFDRNDRTFWHSSTGGTHVYDRSNGRYRGNIEMNILVNGSTIRLAGEQIWITLPEAVVITRYTIKGRQGCCGNPNGRDPCDWNICGKDQQGRWVQVNSQRDQSIDPRKGNSYIVQSDIKYNSYMMIITRCGNPNNRDRQRYCVQISEWNLYAGKRIVNDNERAMIWNPTNIGYTDYDTCKKYAEENAYRYFALQDAKPDGTAACLVSNDDTRIIMYGKGDYFRPIRLWSSRTTGGVGFTALLNPQGSLIVNNSSGAAVFASPGGKVASNYIGCYGDDRRRTMSLLQGGRQSFNVESCQNEAVSGNFKYFGLQNSSSGQNAQCGLSNDDTSPFRLGLRTNCTKLQDGTFSGGGWSNAVYSLDPNQFYYLILEDDGNMCIYKGSSPEDNQGLIWETKTSGKQQKANPNFTAEKSKFGKNWVPNGTTLSAGDFIGSNDGSIYLLLQTDGNLVLNTNREISGCNTNANGKMAGGSWINAIYKFLEPAFKSNIGKLGFVDENNNLHPYPSNNFKFTNTYRKVDQMNTPGNDLLNSSYGNATPEKCQTSCDENNQCYGFVYDNENNVCYPKGSGMWPYGGDARILENTDVYIRGKTPATLPIGVNETTNGIDSVQWEMYRENGPPAEKYGLPVILESQQEELKVIEQNLKRLSTEITGLINKTTTGTTNADYQSNKNTEQLNIYKKDYNNTNKKVNQITNDMSEGFTMNNNINKILEDSDIIVLQKNADYLLWSTLAAGAVLVAMNLTKNNAS